MITKQDIIRRSGELGFADIGFTTAEPFGSQKEILEERRDMYAWCAVKGLDLFQGTNPRAVYPETASIIVLIEEYFREGFPHALESSFGRCYLDDDRVTQDGLIRRIKAFRSFLRDNGIDSKVPFNVPHRLAAARAGLGTFGKNCLLYANRAARGSSWILPMAVLINREFEADPPTVALGCPSWCRNACIAACPTGALSGARKIDPRKCISYLSYYGEDITPPEMREPMGMWVYGCDRCQNVCPRNNAWMSQELPLNNAVAGRAGHFDLRRLLHMDAEYYIKNIWPHMFYMPETDIWRWRMNVARVMGNSADLSYIPDLIRAFRENGDIRVRGMIAWSLGRLGGPEAKAALENFLTENDGDVKKELLNALNS